MLQWLASVVWKIIVLTLAVYYSAWMIFISSISWLKYSLQFWGAPVRHKTPEGLNDKRFKHGYAKLQNGIKLHYAEAGDQTKPLMLCLHGFPEFWYSWRYQMQEFSKDFWVVAVDMRGYGDSDKPEGIQNYHMSKLLEDVKLLPTALGRTKIDVLLAHDWGGAIAWTFVATNPEMVGIYIPMNIPHPSAFQEYIKGSWVQFRKSWYIFFFQMPYLPEWAWRLNDFEWLRTCFTNPKTKAPVISEEDLNAYKNTFSKPGAITYPINYYRAVDFSSPRKLPRVKVPTCLIFGTEDLALETPMADGSARFCNDFEIYKLPNISHWVQQEAPQENGLNLHYVETGERHRPLMLCLHGFPEFWYSWRHQLKEFASDYWVVALDLRGYGESDKPAGVEHYSIKELVNDIPQFLEAIGSSQVSVLLAHDWGGVIGWHLVSERPQLVMKFIPMNCPHPGAFMKNIMGNWKQFSKSWYMYLFQLPWLPEFLYRVNDFKFFDVMFRSRITKELVMSREDLEAFKFVYSKPGSMTYPINYIRAMLKSLGSLTQERRGNKAKISVPTLLIWGTADLALITENAEMSQKYCENFKLHKLSDVSHWVQQEDPNSVNQIIRDFIA
ncbi:unnamed protein product [Cyprideis torosa]|uniref:AB hydrolase-1 domain-containing protein n=1 Tax=Cyprideis torosa TaxID=163714 RepID=A0A7R8W486_9CRUS|nr:unnamed protein product [Cyprideis torosa]CAG0880367.1 unnamed protein product [Cyprideis torosa]